MTREEAIARIKEHKDIHKMNEPRAILISEALEIAIKVLEQEPKIGHWIEIVVNGQHKIKCDKCDYIEPKYATYIRNFCPNCGAKMVEPQESEDLNGKD